MSLKWNINILLLLLFLLQVKRFFLLLSDSTAFSFSMFANQVKLCYKHPKNVSCLLF